MIFQRLWAFQFGKLLLEIRDSLGILVGEEFHHHGCPSNHGTAGQTVDKAFEKISAFIAEFLLESPSCVLGWNRRDLVIGVLAYIDVRVESLEDAPERIEVREPSFDFPAKWLCLHAVFHEIEAKQSS